MHTFKSNIVIIIKELCFLFFCQFASSQILPFGPLLTFLKCETFKCDWEPTKGMQMLQSSFLVLSVSELKASLQSFCSFRVVN